MTRDRDAEDVIYELNGIGIVLSDPDLQDHVIRLVPGGFVVEPPVCAWCTPGIDRPGLSHTICPQCAAMVERGEWPAKEED